MKRILLTLALALGFSHAYATTPVPINCAPAVPCDSAIEKGTGTSGQPAWQAFGIVNQNFNTEFSILQPALSGAVTTPGNSNVTSWGSTPLPTSDIASGNLPSGVLSSSGNALVDTAGAATLTNKTISCTSNTLTNVVCTLHASGDATGATDSAALQALLTAFTFTTSGSALFDNATYYFNASNTITNASNFKIWGSSVGGTVLKMVPNNTPLFTFTASGGSNFTYEWDLGYFQTDWVNPQTFTFTVSGVTTGGVATVTATNGTLAVGQVVGGVGVPSGSNGVGNTITSQLSGTTGGTGTYQLSTNPGTAIVTSTVLTAGNPLAAAVYFTGNAGAQHHDWRIHDIRNANNGFRTISSDTTTNIWGFQADHIVQGGTVGGAMFWSNSVGPRGEIGPNNYISAYGTTASPAPEPSIYINGGVPLVIETTEFNNGAYSNAVSQMVVTNGLLYLIGDRTEYSTIAAAAGCCGPFWAFANEQVTFSSLHAQTLNITGAGSAAFLYGTASSLTALNGSGLDVDTTASTTGSGQILYPYEGFGNMGVVSGYKYTTGGSGASVTDALRANLGNVSQPSVRPDYMTADFSNTYGDTSPSPAIATLERYAIFNTTLTANRTYTLPTCTHDGQENTVIRDAATPGAFTLTVSGYSGGITTEVIASATNGAVMSRCIGTTWVPVQKSAL